MQSKFKAGQRVKIRSLEVDDLQLKYPDLNDHIGKEGIVKNIEVHKIGTVPSDLIEPTMDDEEYYIGLDGNGIIKAPCKALEAL